MPGHAFFEAVAALAVQLKRAVTDDDTRAIWHVIGRLEAIGAGIPPMCTCPPGRTLDGHVAGCALSPYEAPPAEGGGKYRRIGCTCHVTAHERIERAGCPVHAPPSTEGDHRLVAIAAARYEVGSCRHCGFTSGHSPKCRLADPPPSSQSGG